MDGLRHQLRRRLLRQPGGNHNVVLVTERPRRDFGKPGQRGVGLQDAEALLLLPDEIFQCRHGPGGTLGPVVLAKFDARELLSLGLADMAGFKTFRNHDGRFSR